MCCTVVEGEVSVVGAYHAAIASHLVQCTGNVNICNDILDEDCACSVSHECAEVDSCDVCAAFNAKIAYRSILEIGEEAAPLLRYILIIISNGVHAAVEDAGEWLCCCTQH